MKKNDRISTNQMLNNRLHIKANWVLYSRRRKNSYNERIPSCYSAPPDQTSFKAGPQFELQKGKPKACFIGNRKNYPFKKTLLCKISSEII